MPWPRFLSPFCRRLVVHGANQSSERVSGRGFQGYRVSVRLGREEPKSIAEETGVTNIGGEAPAIEPVVETDDATVTEDAERERPIHITFIITAGTVVVTLDSPGSYPGFINRCPPSVQFR